MVNDRQQGQGTDFARTIPVLPSLDIDETRKFYLDILGFEDIWRDDNYLVVRRDEMEFHFSLVDDRIFPENSACYIRGGQVVELYDEIKGKSFKKGKLGTFDLRPWNMKEFHIHDPHGNLLRFGCAPEEL